MEIIHKHHGTGRVIPLTILASLLLSSAPLFAADTSKMTEEQKTLYAIGISISRSLAVFELSADEARFVKDGLADALAGKKSDVDLNAYNGKIQELAKTRRKAIGDRQAIAGSAFLEKASHEKGAVKTPSGMVYTSMVEGKGVSPKAADVVKVNYRGQLIDGKEFDSSYKRGRPLEFKLDNVIRCWTEGVQMMKPGGKAKLVCPPNLAYGDNGAGELILPGATLSFEVELLEVRAEPNKPDAAAKPAGGEPAKAMKPVTPTKN